MRLLLLIFTTLILHGFSNIKDIRGEYKKIQKSIDIYTLKRKMVKSINFSFSKTVYLNNNGVVKKLIIESGGESSNYIKSYFYTDGGKLFFTYENFNNIYGISIEIRRYFNDNLKVIKEIVAPKNGKGDITSPYPIIIKNAIEYFNKKCPL